MSLTDSGVKVRYRPGERQGHGSNLREGCSGSGGEEKGAEWRIFPRRKPWVLILVCAGLQEGEGPAVRYWVGGRVLPKMENSRGEAGPSGQMRSVLISWVRGASGRVVQETQEASGSKGLAWRFSQGTSSTELRVKVHRQQRNALNLPQLCPLGSFLIIIDI